MIAEELNFIGTMCVEFFIDKNDNLYVNEIAQRVHNSGHLTINTHNVSQFENHIRAVCGLEKIKVQKLYNGKMINLIGDDINLYKNKEFNKNEFFFDYLKKEVKKKRKMGHLTIIQKVNSIFLKFFFLNFYLQSKHLFHLDAYHPLNLNQDSMQHLLIEMV